MSGAALRAAPISPPETETRTSGAGAVSAALEGFAQFFESDAEAAAAGASEILDLFPGQPQALLVLISAFRIMSAEAGAREILEWMSQEHPRLASVQYELGMLLARLGMRRQAIKHLSRTVELEPSHAGAWRALGNLHASDGDMARARRAHAQHIRLSLKELRFLQDAAASCRADESARPEAMLRQALAINPTDVVANRILGQLYLRLGMLREAETAFERALKLAPRCSTTRDWYSMTLMQLLEWKNANEQIDILLESDPGNRHLKAQKAANLVMAGEHEEGLRLYEDVRAESENDKVFWLSYGHAARSVGKDDATIVEAYRKAVEIDPGYGTAWWGLANMKTYRFSPAEIARMRDQLERRDIPDGQRCHLEFSLGQALEDAGDYPESFQHYDRGNALRRPQISYSADVVHEEILREKALFTPAFFASRKNTGCPSPDPIFIVGMPRAGSTLVEQILSSHSLVEGTMELPDLGNIVGELTRRNQESKLYPDLLADFDADALRRLGEDYLERTRCQRKLGRPFFTDKTGHNFVHVGLLQLILPNAKVIDARRHPLACGFSCYKQAFAAGAVLLAYDQTDIGRYYRDYVELMAHWDSVLPGRVHRVIHESLLEDPEGEIRRLLSYCGLPFEEQCLRFYQTDRNVRTSSSQQVRQPIRKKPVEAWQHYDAWLQPMKDALGDVLTLYPAVPAFGRAATKTAPQQAEQLSATLERLASSLQGDAEAAATGASEALDTIPGQPQALILLMAALKLMGAEAGAREILEWMSQEHPNVASVQYELGLLYAHAGMRRETIERLSRTVDLEPRHLSAWRVLGNQLLLKGDVGGACKAHARHIRLSLKELRLLEEGLGACTADEFAGAENMMRRAQAINPTDVKVTRLLGELQLRRGNLGEARTTLRRALELAPDCFATRDLYAQCLLQLMDFRAADVELEILLEQEPGNSRLQAQMAANTATLGDLDSARRQFDSIAAGSSDDVLFWLNYGQAARAVGKDERTIIDAYRKCVQIDPRFGMAWWGLADLKTYRFSPSEIAIMREQLKCDDIPDDLVARLHFALGRALEDEGDYARSFEHYDRGNVLLRRYIAHNPEDVQKNVRLLRAFFKPEFFAARKDVGCPSPDPVFIVGMARAGSTLIEQILSSHSQVEGTMELPDLGNIVGDLIREHPAKRFPALLADFDPAKFRRIGEDYLQRTRYQRKLGRPFFTDKWGGNFLHVGLIQLILPNARIIDARRHPLACGFSCFKQAFAAGALLHTYSQTDIARFYRDYVATMAHWDTVLPGRVHRVVHENLLDDPEREIRSLLAYCNLPFEEQCLRFYQTDRSVRTSSSQQVRQPITKRSVEPWQHYEAWLQPMKDVLGDVLTCYPDVPATFGRIAEVR